MPDEDDYDDDFIVQWDADEKSKEMSYEESVSKKQIPLHDLRLKKSENIFLIFGSEGSGISKTVENTADQKVFIPPNLEETNIGKYPYSIVDSLIVGVSAGCMI